MSKVIRITRTDAHGRHITRTRKTKPQRPRPAPTGGASSKPAKVQFTDAFGSHREVDSIEQVA